MRIRRSMILVPANVERMVAKAHDLDADVVTLDLQDGVPDYDNEKAKARKAAVKAIKDGGFRAREISVRVNGPSTKWFLDDVAEIVRAGADSIKLTHARGLPDVLYAEGYLRAVSGGRRVEIILSVEFAQTILALDEISRYSQSITGLQVSPGDYALDMRASQELAREAGLDEMRHYPESVTKSFWRHARKDGTRSMHVVGGRILKTWSSVRKSMLQSRALGFDGLNLLHPSHIETANQVYGPSDDELKWADKIITAFEATDKDRAVAKLENAQLIAPPTYLQACQIRDYAKAIQSGAKEFSFKVLP